ncbi:HD domain-containing protein [Paenibacillus sp. FSL K6-0276]|uniref:HD domain-containing protein n=1 Tax=Paenibacillus sp. FSL K6-0276 TaxID=2921450 RepID=UPI0030EC23B8
MVVALLHDIGHSPFSHVLEQIEGIDHHKRTKELLHSPEISDILSKYDYEPSVIFDLIEGNTISPLRNKDNKIHLDHLDSWVRSAQITGLLQSPAQLLSKLELEGNYISTDFETAELLLQLIISEAKFHCSEVNIGPNVILKHLVTKLIEHNVITVEVICEMTDSRLESYLISCEQTKEEANRLFYRPQEIKVTRREGNDASNHYIFVLNKLYLSEPVINNGKVSVTSLTSYLILEQLSSFLGTYHICWND